MPLSGEVIYHRIVDLGGTLDMKKVRTVLGAMAEAGAVQPSRAAPEYVSFAAPIPLNLSSLNLDLRSEDGRSVTLVGRLYEVGALGMMLRMPVRAETISALPKDSSPQLLLNGQPVKRSDIFQKIADALRPRVKAAYDDVFDVAIDAETYTSYCLTEVTDGAEKIWREQRAQIAGLLIGEAQWDRLAQSEVEDTIKNSFSYFRDDLVVADWDAAFVIEPSGQYEDMLYIFEVANLQLLALRKYDKYLDGTLDRGYDEYQRLSKALLSTRAARRMVSELSTIWMDLANVTDEVANTAKFFGDWYAARVYLGLANKLHVQDYHRIVEEKLETLSDLYESVLNEIDRRQNIVLEVMIVLLIVFEVIMAFVRGH